MLVWEAHDCCFTLGVSPTADVEQALLVFSQAPQVQSHRIGL